jgi:hypothetical protein
MEKEDDVVWYHFWYLTQEECVHKESEKNLTAQARWQLNLNRIERLFAEENKRRKLNQTPDEVFHQSVCHWIIRVDYQYHAVDIFDG